MAMLDLRTVRDVFIPRIQIYGTLSIGECRRLLLLQAGLGNDDCGDFAWPLEFLVGHLNCNGVITTDEAELTRAQRKCLYEWLDRIDGRENWETEDENIFDSIEWHLTEGWQEKLAFTPVPDCVSL